MIQLVLRPHRHSFPAYMQITTCEQTSCPTVCRTLSFIPHTKTHREHAVITCTVRFKKKKKRGKKKLNTLPRLTQLHDIWRQDVKRGSLLQSLPALTIPYSLLVSTHWLMSPAGPLLEPRDSEEELHPLLPWGVPQSSDFPVWPGQGL